MLDRTTNQTSDQDARHQVRDHVVAVLFFGAAGIAMVAWIAAIGWICWRLIGWLLF